MTQPDQHTIESDKHANDRRPPAKGSDRSRVLRPLAFVVPVALLSLTSACGQDTPTAASPVPAAVGTVLTGTVGQDDTSVITLVDSAGAPVTSLKAGSYEVKVKDLSTKHNFHLVGTGVDQKTTVPETTEVTWTVKLAAGTYTFKCDPHAPMVGTFTVT